jgi:hypothetical protein
MIGEAALVLSSVNLLVITLSILFGGLTLNTKSKRLAF